MLKDDKNFNRESVRVYRELKKGYEKGQLEEAVTDYFLNFKYARKIDMITIWRSREYLGMLSDDFQEKNPGIVPYVAIIETMRGNLNKASMIASKLGQTAEQLDAQNMSFDHRDFTRITLEMAMPQYNNAEFVRRARYIVNIMPEPIGGLALNACRPSIINGFRDFTAFCPIMDQKKESIEQIIWILYGGSGKGIFDVAQAEWHYEQGDDFGALIEVAGTVPRLEDTQDIRCLFVAYVLQMRILLIHGQGKACVDMFKKIRKKIYDTCSEEMEASLIATECLFECYRGNLEKIENWMANEAPNENEEIFMMDIYSYFVKMRCYLQTGQHMMALILAKKMLELLKHAERPHDKCECQIVIAIACFKANENKWAVEELAKAFEIGSRYNYIRLFADEGQIMLDMLKAYKTEVESRPDEELFYDKAYIKKIRDIAMDMARTFPEYLQTEECKEYKLTKTEKIVLDLIAKGMTNEEIAGKIDKKEGTIKYHSACIYKKFGVANRQQAINFAKSKGII